ncbi:hypothetical protein ABT364_10640 [Massilia sp. SR12]
MNTNALRQHGILRLVLALCALVFALQMLSASTHKHDLAEKIDDCVACQMSSHFPADLPATPPALLAVFLAVAYLLARLPSAPAFVASPRYLIPPRHAPPRIAS